MTAGGGVGACPFCGGDAHMNGNSQDAQVFVVCDDCDATSDFYKTEERALAAWNRRTPDERYAELIAADKEYDEARALWLNYSREDHDALLVQLDNARARRASALAAMEQQS